MSFKTASAILRGRWLIDRSWTEANLPLILQLAEGRRVELGGDQKDERAAATQIPNRMGAAAYQVNYFSDLSRLPEGSIAVLDIVGPVTKYGDLCSYGSVDHTQTIGRLAAHPNIAGIILNIDSPGGQVDGTSMLATAVKAAGQRKPVIALVDDGIAASAAMWIASAAGELYVSQKTDMVGSIGVYSTIADWYAYAQSQGLPVKDVYAPQSTDKNGSYRAAIQGNEEPLKKELAVIAEEFIQTIRTNRGARLTSEEWTSGGMFYAPQAKKMGLIDGIKSFDQVIGRMNSMIRDRQQKNQNNFSMYEKTFAAAQIAAGEAPEEMNEGMWFTQAQVANIEVELRNGADAVALQATTIQQLTDQATAHENTIQDQATEIISLKSEIESLKGAPAGGISQTAKTDTDNLGSASEEEWPMTSVDREAARLRAFVNP